MNLSRFINVPVMLLLKTGNLINHTDTIIQYISIDHDSVVLTHNHGELTMFHATVQENPNFIMITEAEIWSLSIFLR